LSLHSVKGSSNIYIPTLYVYFNRESINLLEIILIYIERTKLIPCNITLYIGSRDCSVGNATGYGLSGRGSNPGRSKILLFTASRPALCPTQPPIHLVPWDVSLRVTQQGLDADHSPPSSVDVKNDGAISPLPPYVFMTQCLIN
jgi:hypothetical protein